MTICPGKFLEFHLVRTVRTLSGLSLSLSLTVSVSDCLCLCLSSLPFSSSLFPFFIFFYFCLFFISVVHSSLPCCTCDCCSFPHTLHPRRMGRSTSFPTAIHSPRMSCRVQRWPPLVTGLLATLAFLLTCTWYFYHKAWFPLPPKVKEVMFSPLSVSVCLCPWYLKKLWMDPD